MLCNIAVPVMTSGTHRHYKKMKAQTTRHTPLGSPQTVMYYERVHALCVYPQCT